MRLAAYGAISTSLAMAVILTAFQQRPNFYSACVYLSQSNACLMILTNMGVFLTILLGCTVQKLFFGRLRAIEEAHLRERTWFAVTETFLAMTVFRDEFNTRFVVMFVSLLFVKCFHWICQDRIDYMEQFPTIPWNFHVRMVSAMTFFLIADVAFIHYAIDNTIRHGASMMIMFGFEFILLAATLTAVFVKYILNVIDSRQTEAWENRSIYMFYLELATDFFKLVTYLAFFSIILTYYGLPLHIIRDVYITLRSFGKKLMSFIRYRQATAHMNERYPDATVEELDATGDRTCIICREQMVHVSEGGSERTRPKKLRCGHILHFHCLRSWLERQQSCPTCRRPVLDPTPRPTPMARAMPAAPPPPMPAPGPVPIPIQIPGGGEAAAQPVAPGPTPAPLRNVPRMVSSGGPITLPPGYQLPPGWAVIPAHNVQVIPPPTAQIRTDGRSVGAGIIGVPQVVPGGQRGPGPVLAGAPNGNGDAIIAATNDHVNDSVPPVATNTTGPANNTINNTTTNAINTNIPPPANVGSSNPPQLPNLMQRTAANRAWATQSPHHLFPVGIPLVNVPLQQRVVSQASVNGARIDGNSSNPPSRNPSQRVNGIPPTTGERTESDIPMQEVLHRLGEIDENLKSLQDLVTTMSTLLPNRSTSINTTTTTFQPQIQIPHSNNIASTSSSHPGSSALETSPGTSPIRHHHKRRSTSPIERLHGDHEHEAHFADPLTRISTSEDEFSPEEIANIKAPWVEPPLDMEPEIRHPGTISPPRMRSGSASPQLSIGRRGSLLKHDITNQVLSDRRVIPHGQSMDGQTEIETALDKGKGKEVSVEDGSDEE